MLTLALTIPHPLTGVVGDSDVSDGHNYPYPHPQGGNANPSHPRYGMQGEYGGIGAFVKGKEWVPGQCHTYLKVPTPDINPNSRVSVRVRVMVRVRVRVRVRVTI